MSDVLDNINSEGIGLIDNLKNVPAIPTTLNGFASKLGFPLPTILDQITTIPDQIAAAFRLQNDSVGSIAGWNFDIIDNHSLSSTVNVTNYPVLSGQFVGDGISWKPYEYTIKGMISDLVYITPKEDSLLAQLPDNFTLPSEFADINIPKMSVEDIKEGIDQFLGFELPENTDFLKDFAEPESLTISRQQPEQSRTQKLITTLLVFQRQGVPFNVFSPFINMDSGLIESIQISNTHNSRVHEITIKIKEFRQIEQSFNKFNEKNYKGRSAIQNAPAKAENKSLLAQGADNGTNFIRSFIPK